jgi:rubrerythrin
MLKFLNTCAEVEEMVGGVYTLLAENMIGDEALQRFWTKMAEDEASHAMQIRFAMRLPVDHTFKEESFPLEKVAQMLTTAQEIQQKLQNSQISEPQALSLALALEEDFLAVHIDSAVAFKDETIREMLNSLGSADKNHVENLQRVCRERGL